MLESSPVCVVQNYLSVNSSLIKKAVLNISKPTFIRLYESRPGPYKQKTESNTRQARPGRLSHLFCTEALTGRRTRTRPCPGAVRGAFACWCVALNMPRDLIGGGPQRMAEARPLGLAWPGGLFFSGGRSPLLPNYTTPAEKKSRARQVPGGTLDFFRPGRYVRSFAAPHRPPAGKSDIIRKCVVAGATHPKKTDQGGRSVAQPDKTAGLVSKHFSPPLVCFSGNDFINCPDCCQWSR